MATRAWLAALPTAGSIAALCGYPFDLDGGAGATAPGGSNPDAPGGGDVTPNPDDGWETTPTDTDTSDGLNIKGKGGGAAKVIFDLPDGPTAGKEYVIGYVADWSQLSNSGQEVLFGFGLVDAANEEWWSIGLTGGGDTTLEVEQLYESTEFNKGGKPKSVLNQTSSGAAENGTLEGENFIKIAFSADGTQALFYTSSGDETGPWDLEATVSLGTFTDVTEADDFGVFLYMPNTDKGDFQAWITYYSGEVVVSNAPEPTAFSNVISLMQPDDGVITDGGAQTVVDYGYYDSGNCTWTQGASDGQWEKSSPTPPIGSAGWLRTANGANQNPWRHTVATGGIRDPLPATGDFTLETWVRLDTLTAADSWFFLSSWRESGTGARNWWWTLRPDTGSYGFAYGAYPGPSYTNIVATTVSWAIDTNYALAVERYGNIVSLYLDGTRVAQNTSFSSAISLQQGNVYRMNLYSGETANKKLQGFIGPIRLCDEAIIGGAASYDVRTTPFATS